MEYSTDNPLDLTPKTHSRVEIGNSQIVINHKSTPIIIRIVMLILLIICALLPLVVAIAVLMTSGPHFGILFLFLFFWGFGFMLFRILIWNTYGREFLYLWENKIEYLADYKYFKDARQEIGIEHLNIEIIMEDGDNAMTNRLKLQNDSQKIETVLQSNELDMESICKKINEKYGLQKDSRL